MVFFSSLLEGLLRDHHRFLLERLLVQWRLVESETELLDQRLEQIAQTEQPLAAAVARWARYPGWTGWPPGA
jgi:hypothetical protein